MSEKNKKNTPDTPEEQKAEINESIFSSRKELIRQREEETARQEAEIARKYEQQEKETRRGAVQHWQIITVLLVLTGTVQMASA